LRKRKFGANDSEPSNSPVLPGLETDKAHVAEAEDNDTDDASDDLTSGSSTNFSCIAQDLIDDANEDDNSSDKDSDSPLSNAPSTVPHCRIICYFGRQELIPLANLFHFQKPGCSDETPSGRKGRT
jgi:hypothetical protein